jgi:hypothetical protein
MKQKNYLPLLLIMVALTFFISACDDSNSVMNEQSSSSVSAADKVAESEITTPMEADNPDENGTCSDCKGAGTKSGCNVCRNQGWERCGRCSGSGDDGKGNPGCEICFSEGRVSCKSCEGAGINYIGKCIRCNGSGKTTFIDCNNCNNGKSDPKVKILGVCILCEGKGRVEIPAS